MPAAHLVVPASCLPAGLCVLWTWPTASVHPGCAGCAGSVCKQPRNSPSRRHRAQDSRLAGHLCQDKGGASATWPHPADSGPSGLLHLRPSVLLWAEGAMPRSMAKLCVYTVQAKLDFTLVPWGSLKTEPQTRSSVTPRLTSTDCCAAVQTQAPACLRLELATAS